MSEITLLLQNQSFQRNDGAQAEGVTVIFDGGLKEIFDKIMAAAPEYKGYNEVFRDVFVAGLSNFPHLSEFSLILQDQNFERSDGEKVQGITVIIDGGVKDQFDHIMAEDSNFTAYDEVMRDVLVSGLNEFARKYQK